MKSESDITETPDTFLSTLGESICNNSLIDRELANILSIHILKAIPSSDAIAQAKNAILKLANERASLQECEEKHD